MKKNQIIGAVVGIIIVGGGAFYGGIAYAKAHPARGAGFGATAALTARGGMMGGIRGTGGFSTGEIVSNDANGITIKMPSGSTQIILMGTSTQILKSTAGSMSDLTAGTNVVIAGSANSDGSLTAQSIQIRPAGSAFPMGMFGGRQTSQ